RGAPPRARSTASAYAVSGRIDDVCWSRPKGRTEAPQVFLQGRGDCHQALKDGRAGFLAVSGAVEGIDRGRSSASCDYALRDLARQALDGERLQCLLEAGQAATRKGRGDRLRSDPLWAAPHGRSDYEGARVRRANDRRRPRPEDNRDGPSLRQGRGTKTEDAQRSEVAGCRMERTKNKNCQTWQLRVSNRQSHG